MYRPIHLEERDAQLVQYHLGSMRRASSSSSSASPSSSSSSSSDSPPQVWMKSAAFCGELGAIVTRYDPYGVGDPVKDKSPCLYQTWARCANDGDVERLLDALNRGLCMRYVVLMADQVADAITQYDAELRKARAEGSRDLEWPQYGAFALACAFLFFFIWWISSVERGTREEVVGHLVFHGVIFLVVFLIAAGLFLRLVREVAQRKRAARAIDERRLDVTAALVAARVAEIASDPLAADARRRLVERLLRSTSLDA